MQMRTLGTTEIVDEAVPPGLTPNRADAGYTAPALADPSLRRR